MRFGDHRALYHVPIVIIPTLDRLNKYCRAKMVYDGVTHAAKLFPNAYLVMIIIGTIKGNGESFMRIFERLVRGVWTPESVEFLKPNL